MPNLPMTQTCEETKAAISRIEHNSAGQGAGPSGKKAGPPTAIEGGSGSNFKSGTSAGVPTHVKGGDWITPGNGRK